MLLDSALLQMARLSRFYCSHVGPGLLPGPGALPARWHERLLQTTGLKEEANDVKGEKLPTPRAR
jgi:hypothetical protein